MIISVYLTIPHNGLGNGSDRNENVVIDRLSQIDSQGNNETETRVRHIDDRLTNRLVRQGNISFEGTFEALDLSFEESFQCKATIFFKNGRADIDSTKEYGLFINAPNPDDFKYVIYKSLFTEMVMAMAKEFNDKYPSTTRTALQA